MATFTTDATQPGAVSLSGLQFERKTFKSATTTQFATGDILRLAIIPGGSRVTGFMLDVPDIDSATTLVFDLGDATTQTAFGTGITIGRSPGFIMPDSTGVTAQKLPTAPYAADSDFRITVTTGSTGAGTGGLIQGWIDYQFCA